MVFIKPLELIKENEKGQKFVGDDFELFTRKARSVSGPNSVDYEKTEYLLQGKALLKTGDGEQEVIGPCAIYFPSHVEHSIIAQTNCLLMKLK